CLQTAAKIKEGDGESWYTHWNDLASRVHRAADESLAKGHSVSAAEALFRASNYYRNAHFFLHGNKNDPRIFEAGRKSRETFRRAVRFMKMPVEFVPIPYENTTLPGYLFTPDNEDKPRKTLLLQTGFDGTGEEMYFSTGFFALKRGYNVLIFEGPGQGMALLDRKLHFRHDWERVVTPVVDYVLARDDVDPARIALLGVSMGGYLAPRAAAFEHRLAALVVNPGVYDVYGGHEKSEEQWAQMEKHPDETNAFLRKKMEQDIGFRWLMNNGMFAFGAGSPLEFMTLWKKYNLRGVADKIKCPTLVVMSMEDHLLPPEAQRKLYDQLASPKTLMTFDGTMMAAGHCQMGAIAEQNRRILDWLDETLADKD
ncbi:MAG: alpha/beta fold hydrolase, partial [Nitrospinota bacterium]|nr:alpha/beta fold hydrolase [Nitrospinota bacterium]